MRALQRMLDDLSTREDEPCLSDRARELLARGTSQSSVARELGISRRRVAEIARGKEAPECEPCDGLLTQVLAVRAAVEQVGLIVMELHLQRCLSEELSLDEDGRRSLHTALKRWTRFAGSR